MESEKNSRKSVDESACRLTRAVSPVHTATRSPGTASDEIEKG